MSAKFADKDINVLKVLLTNGQNIYSPLRQDHQYRLNEQANYVAITPIQGDNSMIINEGYHSFAYPTKAMLKRYDSVYGAYYFNYDENIFNMWTRGNLYEDLYVCVIPKGTKYYANEYYEIVSETIIVKKAYEFLE